MIRGATEIWASPLLFFFCFSIYSFSCIVHIGGSWWTHPWFTWYKHYPLGCRDIDFFGVYAWHTGNIRKQAKNPIVLRNHAYGWHTDSAIICILDTLPFFYRQARKNEQMRSKREEKRSALPSAVNPAGRLTHCLSPAWFSTLENAREIPRVTDDNRFNSEVQHLKSCILTCTPRTPARIACIRFEWLGGAFSRMQTKSRETPNFRVFDEIAKAPWSFLNQGAVWRYR